MNAKTAIAKAQINRAALALGMERGSVIINKANSNSEPLVKRWARTSQVQPNHRFRNPYKIA